MRISLRRLLASFLAVLFCMPAFAQFQPPVGPIGTSLILDTVSPHTHTQPNGGVITLTRVFDNGNTIRYTVNRPNQPVDLTFERARPSGSTTAFSVTAALIGDHGLLFLVRDADSTRVRNTAVFLDLSRAFPVEQNLYSRQDLASHFPSTVFFQNADGSCLFTPVFLQGFTLFPASELSVFRMDTGEFLCGMGPQSGVSNVYSANILDTGLPVGSDSVRIRKDPFSGANVDQVCGLPQLAPPQTTRQSETSGGTVANALSVNPAISGNGRHVSFESAATNLVPNDTNARLDIFVRDRISATITRVSVGPSGLQANGDSFGARISEDSRFVVFTSNATNLIGAGSDSNARRDVFVRDRTTSVTSRVSVSSSGAQANSDSGRPAISRDGRFVAFDSNATNLVSNDDNVRTDVFVHDRVTATTSRVSVTSAGLQATGGSSSSPAMSADGRFVAFQSAAINLDSSDTNQFTDIFLRDRTTASTTIMSGGHNNHNTRPAISGNGLFVAFQSPFFGQEFNIFVMDRQNSLLRRVSQGFATVFDPNADCLAASLSGSGGYVAFHSAATNLIQPDTNLRSDIFMGLTNGLIGLSFESLASNGAQLLLGSDTSAVSGDGRFVAFASGLDILVRDRGALGAGTFDLTPTAATVAVEERLTYAFIWAVPEPMNWHDLQFLQLRIRDGADTALSVLWEEASNTFRVFNDETGEFGEELLPGGHAKWQTPWARLDMAETSVVGSGPTGPSVTLNLAVRFRHKAVGHKLQVEVAGSDDQDNQSDFDHAGTVTVTRPHGPGD